MRGSEARRKNNNISKHRHIEISTPRTDNLYHLFPILHDLDHVAERDPYNLHDVAQVSWVGYVQRRYPAQPLTTARDEPDDLDQYLSDLFETSKQRQRGFIAWKERMVSRTRPIHRTRHALQSGSRRRHPIVALARCARVTNYHLTQTFQLVYARGNVYLALGTWKYVPFCPEMR